MDLRQMGSPFEKKYTELTDEDRKAITDVYHNWQQEGHEETYKDVPYRYSASKEEVAMRVLYPRPKPRMKLLHNRDENIDFDTKMKALPVSLKTC